LNFTFPVGKFMRNVITAAAVVFIAVVNLCGVVFAANVSVNTNGDYLFTVRGETAAAASCFNGPVMIGDTYYQAIQFAYDAAYNKNTLNIFGTNFFEDLIFDRDVSVILKAGYDCEYLSNSLFSTVTGDLTISGGTITVENIILQTAACTDYIYSDWSACINNSQSRNVIGYTPQNCTGTPPFSPILAQSCGGGVDPPGTITLQQNNEEAVILDDNKVKYFKFTTPAGGCSAYPLKWLVITMINVDLTAGDGQLLVKSTNNGASPEWPTLADYTYLFGKYGYSLGQDWTRAGNGGVFFWRWTIGAPSEALVILPSYTGHTFNQDDTYYLLLYNQGETSNEYRVLWQCS
jgi:hypothetical protein